jgi:hypothetical protein
LALPDVTAQQISEGKARMRAHRVPLCAAILAGSVALAAPAQAVSGTTTTTFVVTGGSLAITVPASVALGSAAPGGTITAQTGTVQVTDNRALLAAAWTATVSTTSFTTGGATTPETVPAADVSYWSGPSTASTLPSATGTFTPGQANAAAAVALGTSQTAFTLASGVGDNSLSWNPTLIVTLPAAAVAGTYTGTITHSVA